MKQLMSPELQLKLRVILRNLKAQSDFLLFLCKWDQHARREMLVTLIAGVLILYLLVLWHTPAGLVAVLLLAVALFTQLGWPPSFLPPEYRPELDKLFYSAETVAYVTRNDKSYAMADIFPAQTEAGYNFYNPLTGRNLCPESPLVSNTIDDQIMKRKNLPFKLEENKQNYIYSRHQLLYIAIRIANRIQNTQNLLKLELYDTAASLMDLTKPLIVRPSYYFKALLTAEAFRSHIFRNNIEGEKEVYTDLTGYFPANEEKLNGKDILRFAPEFYKRVSGRIGVTTLLLTENRRVAMLLQGASKPVGGQQINLGGSGSINLDDIELSGNTGDLHDVITYAMTRELCEETGMKEWFGQAHIHTMVTGFFRWIDRCGHPEFIGITYVRDVPFSKKNRIDGDEVVKYEEIPITIETPQDFVRVWEHIQVNKLNVALSSLMALHRLTVIASYDVEAASDTQKQVYRDLAYFIRPQDTA